MGLLGKNLHRGCHNLFRSIQLSYKRNEVNLNRTTPSGTEQQQPFWAGRSLLSNQNGAQTNLPSARNIAAILVTEYEQIGVSMEEIVLTAQITSFKVHVREITICCRNPQNVSTGSGLIGRLTFKHTQSGKITNVSTVLRI
jgi:hypothetical protein